MDKLRSLQKVTIFRPLFSVWGKKGGRKKLAIYFAIFLGGGAKQHFFVAKSWKEHVCGVETQTKSNQHDGMH